MKCNTEIQIITGEKKIMQTVKCGEKDYNGNLIICFRCQKKLKENSINEMS